MERPVSRLGTQQIVTEFLAISQKQVHPLRSAYDNIVLTAHLRVGPHFA